MTRRMMLLAMLLLSACGGASVDDYADKKPTMDIRKFLNGTLDAKGVLFDGDGKQEMHFHAVMKGSWQGDFGTMHEDFVWDTGRRESRTWKITMEDAHHFIATAEDVDGLSIGTQNGNAANMKYTLNAKRENGDTISVSMDDSLFLVDDKTVINRAEMHKYGLMVGELVTTITKR